MKKTSLALTKFMVPWMLGGIVALIIYLSGAYYYTRFSMVLIIFFEICTGEVTSILVGIGAGLNPILVVLFVTFLESDISIFTAWNFDILKRIPRIGNSLIKYEGKAKKIIEKKRLEKIGFMGLLILVMIPVHGTGALPSTIIGRLLGFGWKKTWLCVTTGCAIRSSIIALLAYSGYLAVSGILP
ncbi:MAG: small multi-drug export protein [Candidatus Thermoplasmatota archaeon]|nr:small multi-drug export protein [Candidatus Thermoplasmatota archaeon]MBU4256553.1 small multi-drug export protein [Candidatus Thermoplasmatota archaeon]MCG2825204.1 small multi-drug export protein [Thermoplasmatales archaeon]